MVLQVFLDGSAPRWHVSVDHVYLVYGHQLPNQAGMYSVGHMTNARAGYDVARGRFHVLLLSEAQALSALLVRHAYVRFGDTVYQPTVFPWASTPRYTMLICIYHRMSLTS